MLIFFKIRGDFPSREIDFCHKYFKGGVNSPRHMIFFNHGV